MNALRHLLVAAACTSLVGCGGGSTSEEPLQRHTPRVAVSGLATGEQVVFTLAGEQITAGTNTTFSRSGAIIGEYRAVVDTPPAGKLCRFNGNSTSYQGTDSRITLVCGAGSGGGGGGPVSQVSGSFQHWPWDNLVKVTGAPMWILPISLLDFDNNGLTGATAANFMFELEDRAPALPGSEFRVFVQPITVGTISLRGTIAIDVSTSFTDGDLEVLKDEVSDFFGTVEPHHIYRLTTFEGEATEQQPWTTDAALLQSAAQGIPTSGRLPATDVYGAAVEATSATTPMLDVLDHVVIVTDGEDFSTESYGTYSDDLDHKMIFVIQIGDIHESDLARLETLVQVGKDSTFPDRLVRVPGVADVGGALVQVQQYMESMADGLHHMWVGLPYEDGEVRLTFSTNPREDCDAEASLGGCGWYTDLDTTGSTVASNTIYAIPNAVTPRAGDTVRFDIPRDWRLCSDNPMFQWGPITETSGAATGTASADGFSYELALGTPGPVDVSFSVTDVAAAVACSSNTIQVITP